MVVSDHWSLVVDAGQVGLAAAVEFVVVHDQGADSVTLVKGPPAIAHAA